MVVMVKVEPVVIVVVLAVVVVSVVVVAVPTSVCPQGPSLSEGANSFTQRPYWEDHDVPDPQQKQSRQQICLTQDVSPGAGALLGKPDSNLDGESLRVMLGETDSRVEGDLDDA